MHILAGLVVLVIALGALFFIYQANLADSLGLRGIFRGISNSTSTTPNSQHHEDVRIQFVSLGNGSNQPMTVTLERVGGSEEGVVVTGWSLKTNVGTYTIPRAANLYSPSVEGLPPEDIYLRRGGKITLYSNSNPRGGPRAIRSAESEWQIWLEREFLTSPHGTITLRDRDGKLVDQYRY